MSRTYAHRPYHARLALPRVAVDCHDHSDGPCDLAEVHEFIRSLDPGTTIVVGRRCSWDVDPYRVPPICGCQLCTGQPWRRAERRADRQVERRRLRLGRWAEEY